MKSENGTQPKELTHPHFQLKLVVLHIWQRVFHFDTIRPAVSLKNEIQVVLRFRPHSLSHFAGVSTTQDEFKPGKRFQNQHLAV
jgi:hypothetical protein